MYTSHTTNTELQFLLNNVEDKISNNIRKIPYKLPE